eukprot:607425-Rhodomonas_salina.2
MVDTVDTAGRNEAARFRVGHPSNRSRNYNFSRILYWPSRWLAPTPYETVCLATTSTNSNTIGASAWPGHCGDHNGTTGTNLDTIGPSALVLGTGGRYW